MEEQTAGRRRINWRRACVIALMTVVIAVVIAAIVFPCSSAPRSRASDCQLPRSSQSNGASITSTSLARSITA